jgi:hypothetical protein
MKWFELMSSSKSLSIAKIMEYTIPKDQSNIDDYRRLSGFDERFFEKKDKKEEMDAIYMESTFHIHLQNMYWLQLLQQYDICTLEKLEIVKQTELFSPSSHYITNIAAGGLMNDFDNVF